MGVIYAVLLRVRRQFWLSETITLHKWTELRGQLGGLIRAYGYVEVIINLHVLNGDNTCMLTLRDEVPKPTVPSPPKPFRNLFSQLIANLPGAGDFLDALVIARPTIVPKLVEEALNDLADPNPHMWLPHPACFLCSCGWKSSNGSTRKDSSPAGLLIVSASPAMRRAHER